MNTQTIETLKSQGRMFHAGALAFLVSIGNTYGCHYGFRSTLNRDVAEFRAGYAAASDAFYAR